MSGKWKSWQVRTRRLRHLDAELAPVPIDSWRQRRRQWWLFLTVPFMPVVGLAVLAWGTVMFFVASAAGAAKLIWEALPASGTTRRGLTRLWAAWKNRRGDAEA